MGANEGQVRCVTGFYNKEARYRIRWLHLAFYSVLQDHRWPHNSGIVVCVDVVFIDIVFVYS